MIRAAAAVPVRLWDRWIGLLTRQEAGSSLALFRIGCGLSVIYSLGSVVLHGLAPVLWMGPDAGGYTVPAPPWLFRWIGGVTPTTVNWMIAVALVSGALLVVGLGGRVMALIALQSYLAVTGLNPGAGGAYDWLLTNALWLLVLGRSTATLALDCRIRTGRWRSDTPVSAWPRYLAIYQLVLTYWSTGMHKLSTYWLPSGDFAALYYILQEPTWQRGDMSWLAWVYPATQVLTAVTWLWEVSAPLLLLALYYRRTRDRPGRLRALFNRVGFRRLFIAVGLGVHIGIVALMDVGPFTLVTLAYYPCLFHPDEWRAVVERLTRRAGRPAAPVG